MRKKLFSILALLLMALTAQATDYPTGLTDGQVLYVGDTFTPEVTYRLPNWSINSNIAPVKLVRFNVTSGEKPWDRATLEEAADGQYYGFMDNDGDIRTYWDEYDNVLVGLGEYAFEATENSDGLIVTKSGANVSFAIHEASNAPAGTELSHDATRKVWTLDAMPAGNVELQVAYYPGMLVKPTSLVGGTMEIEGVTDTALPDGFEKDDAGNIYVEAGKKFTVKAVPATGYHLVGWSDDATIKDLEREFTMPADGSDFTVTATFSDEFELTFDDVNFKTNQNITVKVGDADKTLDQDGKLSVKSGQTVTLTAKQGYKFRSVEAKKAAKAKPALSINIGDASIHYNEGELWKDAIQKYPTENAGWSIDGNTVKYNGNYTLCYDDWSGSAVFPQTIIDATEAYKLVTVN